MSNEQNFLITYGLHNFVTHVQSKEKLTFTICGMESEKLISHAKSLIDARYGNAAHIRVT